MNQTTKNYQYPNFNYNLGNTDSYLFPTYNILKIKNKDELRPLFYLIDTNFKVSKLESNEDILSMDYDQVLLSYTNDFIISGLEKIEDNTYISHLHWYKNSIYTSIGRTRKNITIHGLAYFNSGSFIVAFNTSNNIEYLLFNGPFTPMPKMPFGK